MKTRVSSDSVQRFGGSLLQHGKLNDRVYLMKIDLRNIPELLDYVDRLIENHKYGKVFGKVPASGVHEFACRHYHQEAVISGYYGNGVDCMLMSRFFDVTRMEPQGAVVGAGEAAVVAPSPPPPLPNGYTLQACTPADVEAMAEIYAETFDTYPFPIQDAAYIFEAMTSHVDYFGIQHEGQWIALSSAEMDLDEGSVEMTDFAVLPLHRGRGLSRILLTHMENRMRERHMRIAYTIARAASPGMNRAFARAAYTFGGTLVHNTSICGTIESMNVWHKSLLAQPISQDCKEVAVRETRNAR